MPNPDPFLRAGLSPPTDVELYASEAAGGTTTPVAASTTATGVAAVSLVPALGRQFAVTTTGVASVERTATLARTLDTTTTGIAAESHEFVSGTEAPAAAPANPYGNSLGTYYVQPPDFRPEVIRARRCRCMDGHASIDCSMHCHLVITRQHVEDELLVLALV